MAVDQIRFDDGAAYERYMGGWSRLVGKTFLDWLAPASGLRWLDVGCGGGAFTQLLVEGHAPASVHGIDPSLDQLKFARARLAARGAQFKSADAQAQPFADDTFDAAVMPLVIFFVPDPAKGVSEMARVVRPGGYVAAYAWDLPGGGFPYEAVKVELRELGMETTLPPSPDASDFGALRELWTGAGLEAVETRDILVQHVYSGFDEYWSTVLLGPSTGPRLKALMPDVAAQFQARLHARLPVDASGRIVCTARANAIKGRLPDAKSGQNFELQAAR